jgi:hypothetical protein
LHTIKGRIYDGAGNVTEREQIFTVIATQEDWRQFWFGTPSNTGNAADSADPDGDGLDNRLEYVTGMNPTAPQSRFGIKVELVPGQPSQMAITFGPIVSRRVYTLQYKANLADPTWMTLPNSTSTDNGTERTVIDLSAGSGLRLYRVEVELPAL